MCKKRLRKNKIEKINYPTENIFIYLRTNHIESGGGKGNTGNVHQALISNEVKFKKDRGILFAFRTR